MNQHGEKCEEETTKSPPKQRRSGSPVPSCVSMKSDQSMGVPILFREDTEAQDIPPEQKGSGSPVPSCVSMKSNQSMGLPIFFREDTEAQAIPLKQERPKSSVTTIMMSNQSMAMSIHFSTEDTKPQPIHQAEPDSPADSLLLDHSARHKIRLETQYQNIQEGTFKQDSPTLLQDVYTELYIIVGGRAKVNTEHEIRYIEALSRQAELEDTVISHNDVFKCILGEDAQIRTVMTTGLAGIGKTVMVKKFILDWSQGRGNQDIHFIIPIEFRELNLVKTEKYSIVGVLRTFIESIKNIQDSSEIEKYLDTCKLLFILDGLDECRIPLDFQNTDSCHDITETTSVDVLLINLIKGNLLPSALVWITSRPAAANQIPPQYIDRLTDLQGFKDLQKEVYFRKTISDENLANRALTHLKSCRSLYIMCYIPLFSWMSSVVLQRMLKETEKGELPTRLTEMYTQFLVIHTDIRQKKYNDTTGESIIFKLGKLAFEQLQANNLTFYEDDLKQCGLDVEEASLYSGVCTEIFKKDFVFFEGRYFSFVHLSVQEYLAALYAYLSLMCENKNVLDPQMPQHQSKPSDLPDLYKTAVDLALQSENGQWDLFLRFLIGFSLESNQKLLQEVLPEIRNKYWSNVTVTKYLKKMIREYQAPEKRINLFHCLNELNDHSIVSDVQSYLKSGLFSTVKLTCYHWAALNFVLLTSGRELDVFDLSQYGGSSIAIHYLLPVVKASRTVLVSKYSLADKDCKELASAIKSSSTSLRELDLRFSKLSHAGVKHLSNALENPNCKLQAFRVNGCKLPVRSCAMLASALGKTSTLTELNLNENEVEDSGAQLIASGLNNPQCKLQVLRLRSCGITEAGFHSLASALQSKPSLLRELDLSMNKPGHAGLKVLCDALSDPPCELHILKLNNCGLTDKICVNLASVLDSLCLRELQVSDNRLQDSGLSKISSSMAKQHCKLEVLKLCNCSITEEGYRHLASALRSNPSHLRELYLSWNPDKERGVEVLSELHHDPQYALAKLEL